MTSRRENENVDSSQRAYDHVIELIASRRLQSGNLIEPREIATTLAISMSPVTRALQRLEQEGLVRILPRKGTFVENSNPRSLFDHLMMREALECQAARIYCGKAIEENMEQLLALARGFDDASSEPGPTGDLDRWMADIELHRFLVSLTKSSDLIKAYQSSMRLGLLINVSLFTTDGGPPASHAELVTGLTTQDSDEAEHLIREHLRSNKPSPLEFLDMLGHKTWKDI